MLDKDADEIVNAQKYERTAERQGYRSGHYREIITQPQEKCSQRFPNSKEFLTRVSVRRAEDLQRFYRERGCPRVPSVSLIKRIMRVSKQAFPHFPVIIRMFMRMVFISNTAEAVKLRMFLFLWQPGQQ